LNLKKLYPYFIQNKFEIILNKFPKNKYKKSKVIYQAPT